MTTDEAEIRERIDTLRKAIQAMDLDSLKPIFAPDIVSFDIVPPLRHVGAAAKWQNWADVFTAYQPPLGYEIGELTIIAGGDVAFVYGINRISGALRNGAENSMWVRWTAGFRKIDGNWLIVHDQVSVPIDVATGKALVTLQP